MSDGRMFDPRVYYGDHFDYRDPKLLKSGLY